MTRVSVSLSYLDALSRADGMFDINLSHLWPGELSSTVRILETSMSYTCTSSEAVCKLPITVKYWEDKGGLGLEFMNQNPKYQDLVFSAPSSLDHVTNILHFLPG